MCGKYYPWIGRAGLTALFAAVGLHAGAMTVAQLRDQLAQRNALTVIDVRLPGIYAEGHIPGAINVPASVLPYQNLPPFGHVVVCGAGVGRDALEDVVAALARKPGCQVEVLDGGYAAWSSALGDNTRGRGLHAEVHHYLTYADLQKARAGDTVLLDLRKAPAPLPAGRLAGVAAAHTPLTDLATTFPGLPVVKTVPAESGRANSTLATSGSTPLLVLIDNADGTAEAMGRNLLAGGNRRYAILLGGEEILARGGQAGLQRKSNQKVVPAPKTVAPVFSPTANLSNQ